MSSPKPSCDVCNESYTVEDALLFLDLCEEHREAVVRFAAERSLRAVIPPGFHHAHPRDLPESLRSWNPLAGSGVYIYGPVGCGKSHAAAALLKKAYMASVRIGVHPKCVWLNVPSAIMETLADISARRDASRRWVEAQDARYLVLDDIGMEQPKEWVRTRLYALIEHRLQQSLATIVTSNLDLNGLAERLESEQIASRLSQITAQVSFGSQKDRRPSLAPQLGGEE